MPKLKIALIIEDDKILSKTISEELHDAGFDVWQAFDGKKGLQLIKSKKPDIVLLDLMLPKIPGEQVLKKMNESGLIKKIPVIVLSAKGNEANVKNCLEILGASDYLTKSDYTLKKIIAKINKIVGK